MFLGIAAAASAAISVFIFAGWKNDVDQPPQADYAASFYLEIIGACCLGIGTALFFFGLGREGVTATPTTEGAPYAPFNDTSYIQQQQQVGYASYAQ